MSGTYLYCQSCGNYLGSLGGNSCICGWTNQEEQDECKQWVDLTESEIFECLPIASLTKEAGVWFKRSHVFDAIKAASEKLKEKNA